MGMGEPLANYKNVLDAVRRINTELGIGARHITISTVGLVPRIIRLSQEDIQVKAIDESLDVYRHRHRATPETSVAFRQATYVRVCVPLLWVATNGCFS